MAHFMKGNSRFPYARSGSWLSLLLFPVFAVVLTWPLILHLATHVPLGSEPAATVPFLNIWTIGWNGESLRGGISNYWDAPIFYPTRGTFAFSDPQPLTGIPGLLLWGISPALAYNMVLLGYLTLTGYVTYHLLLERHIDLGPAIIGGLLVMMLPFLTNERGVLQLQSIFGPIWGIAALWALLDRSSIRRAIYLGLAVGVTFLTSEYYALLLFPALALAFLVHAPEFREIPWRKLALASAIALLLVLPFGLAQNSKLQAMGFQRSDASFARTSAWPADYLRPSSRLRIAEIAPEFDLQSNQRLYPGIIVSLLAILGSVTGYREGGSKRRWILFLLLVGTFGFALSMGSHLSIGGISPLTTLHRELPFLAYTRSAFRFGALAQLALVLLAAGGVAWVWDRNKLVAVVIACLALLELAPKPERLVETPAGEPAWSAAIAGSENPVLVHLPWAQDRRASSFADTTRWMIESLLYQSRLTNGYSGFFPQINTQLRELLEHFPDERSLGALEAAGVDYIVLHGTLDPEIHSQIGSIVDEGRFTDVTVSGGLTIIQMPDGLIRSIAEYEGDWHLRVDERNGSTHLEGLPSELDGSTWMFVRDLTDLDWALGTLGDSDQSRDIYPKGAVLFFEGSDDWLRLATDLSSVGETELIDNSTGQVIGSLPTDDPP